MTEVEELKKQVEELKDRIVILERHLGISQRFEDDGSVNRDFEQLIFAIDERSLQRVFREIDQHQDLPIAFARLPKESMDKVRRCVSENQWKLDIEPAMKNFEERWQTRGSEIAIVAGEAVAASRTYERIISDKRRKILRTIRQLEEMGEIVLAQVGTLEGVEVFV